LSGKKNTSARAFFVKAEQTTGKSMRTEGEEDHNRK
jgi:hypothetical protein